MDNFLWNEPNWNLFIFSGKLADHHTDIGWRSVCVKRDDLLLFFFFLLGAEWKSEIKYAGQQRKLPEEGDRIGTGCWSGQPSPWRQNNRKLQVRGLAKGKRNDKMRNGWTADRTRTRIFGWPNPRNKRRQTAAHQPDEAVHSIHFFLILN